MDPLSVRGLDSLSTFRVPFLMFEGGIGSPHQFVYMSTSGWFLSERVELPVGPGARASCASTRPRGRQRQT